MVLVLLVFNTLHVSIKSFNLADTLQLSVTVMQAAATIAANLPMMASDKTVTLTE